MRIVVTSVLVDDQDRALRYYTRAIAFELFSSCIRVGGVGKQPLSSDRTA